MYNQALLLIFFIFSFYNFGTAQINWSDNFQNGNFQFPKSWKGDTNQFKVNNNFELQLEADNSASPAALITPSAIALNAEWQFYVRLEFSPSTSNYAEVFVMSDSTNLITTQNGYFIRIGGISGNGDDVSLFKKLNGQTTELIDGRDGIAGNSIVDLKVKLTRDSLHHWKLYTDTSLVGSYELEGSVYDSSISSSRFFGLKCIFTSTRSDKFYFDNFNSSGEIYADKTPIVWRGLELIDSSNIRLSFSEIPSHSTALNTGNFQILYLGIHPSIISFDQADSSSLILQFNSPFPDGDSLFLEVKGIEDKRGNQMATESRGFFYFKSVIPNYRDIIISEIFFDPFPIRGLPDAEYIELFNRSDHYFQLDGWIFSDASSSDYLPDFILSPRAYVILCNNEDSADFAAYGDVIAFENFPALNNSGDELSIQDKGGRLIDQLNYENSWYASAEKEEGGWSVEIINPYKVCNESENFIASTAQIGGSPGTQNSVYDTLPDLQAPFLMEYSFLQRNRIGLKFNEALDTTLALLADFDLGNTIDVLAIEMGNNNRELELLLDKELDSSSSLILRISNLYDCEGNLAGLLSYEIILAARASFQDIVINEILFNPKKGGSDFIEVYNKSDRLISLDNWQISNQNGIVNVKRVDTKGQIIRPHEYWVLTEDANYIRNEYLDVNPSLIIQMDLPSYNDDNGEVFLANERGDLIDHFIYDESMHFDLLISNEGVSLERINPFGPSSEMNFFSAAEKVNFASPTRVNSQFSMSKETQSILQLRSDVFSPDQDGYEDLLIIDFQFREAGYVGNLKVFDAEGRAVKELLAHQLMERQGSIRWDGLDEENRKASIGIYLLLFEAFSTKGEVIIEKVPVVLAGRLD